MSEDSRSENPLIQAAQALKADNILLDGELTDNVASKIVSLCAFSGTREKVCLIVRTPGGYAGAAYKIARFLQRKYNHFSLIIPSFCKSAGTLLAIGAEELVMSDFAELGPLDVQIQRKDELFEIDSGLTLYNAFVALRDQAFEAFENYFLNLRIKSGSQISTKRCFEAAERMATALFAPIYGQIDPMKVGEVERAMHIAQEYGLRLMKKTRSISEDNLGKLLTGYPDHGFVIDHVEASELFENVRYPNSQEAELISLFLSNEIDTQGTTVIFTPYHLEEDKNTTIQIPQDQINEEPSTKHPEGATT